MPYKYTPEGGEIWVGAALEAEDTETNGKQEIVHHWVKDTGIGMDEEEPEQPLPEILPDLSAVKAWRRVTGLGLNITKNLVESHGGRIWVESAVGEGDFLPLHDPGCDWRRGERSHCQRKLISTLYLDKVNAGIHLIVFLHFVLYCLRLIGRNKLLSLGAAKFIRGGSVVYSFGVVNNEEGETTNV